MAPDSPGRKRLQNPLHNFWPLKEWGGKSSFYEIKRKYCVKRESLAATKQKMPLMLVLTIYKQLIPFVFLVIIILIRYSKAV